MFENDDRGRIDDIFITKNCASHLISIDCFKGLFNAVILC